MSPVPHDRHVTTQSMDLFSAAQPLVFECGNSLSPVTVAFETYGALSPEGDNAILVCHALTGSAHAAGFSSDDPLSVGWWDPFIGPGKGLDTREYFVVCANFLGGCYGSSGPTSVDPRTGERYGLSFPLVTVRDMVRVQRELMNALGVRRLKSVIGGSLGGMQVLEWGAMYPDFVESIIPIATAAQHSPWCIGLNEIAREAITNDPAWKDGAYDPSHQPEQGLSLARQIAMISYRSDISFMRRFGRERKAEHADERSLNEMLSAVFQVESYLRYQGAKLVARFDANTYLYISRAMDLHDLAVGRGPLDEVMRTMRMPALCVGISSDILYPPHEQQVIAAGLGNGRYCEISSHHGHDAFLIEYEQLAGFVRSFLRDVEGI